MRMAANAGRYVAAAARITPGGIVTAAVATWLFSEGLAWVDGQWQHDQNASWTYQQTYYRYSINGKTCVSPGATADFFYCNAKAANPNNEFYGCRVDSINPTTGAATGGCTRVASPSDVVQNQTVARSSCSSGQVIRPDGVCGQPMPGSYIPATETDWSKFDTKPVPDQVANDTPGPLPVGLPSINPDPAGVPQTVTVPTGSPQPVPDSVPQQYRQPVTDIVPSPTQTEPWRVDERPREHIGTDPAGLPQTPGTSAQPGVAEDELITCGLPGKPKCLIDEQDTPTPTTANPAPAPQPQTEVDAATKATRDIIADVPGKLGPFPTISWAFQLPSACGPILTPAFDPYLTQIDVCQFQGTFHDIMSVVWILGGLFGAIGLFWRDQLVTA